MKDLKVMIEVCMIRKDSEGDNEDTNSVIREFEVGYWKVPLPDIIGELAMNVVTEEFPDYEYVDYEVVKYS